MLDNWPSGRTNGILVNFNIKENKIKELSSEVVYSHPDLGLQYESFRAEAFSSAGEMLNHFGIWDPRISLGSEMVYTDDTNFTIIFPFYDNLKTFEIKNVTTKELLVSVDLTNTLRDYCSENDYVDQECQTLDLDNDGIKDYKELEVHGMKWEDLNANGKKDPNDHGLGSWEIKLEGTEAGTGKEISITTTTDINGNYSFTNLTPGTYNISEKLKNGWIQTAPTTGTYTVKIKNGSIIKGQDFGNFKLGEVHGMKWKTSTPTARKILLRRVWQVGKSILKAQIPSQVRK